MYHTTKYALIVVLTWIGIKTTLNVQNVDINIIQTCSTRNRINQC